MTNIGLIRVATATPKLKVANTEFNTTEILECLKCADKTGAGIMVFPELCMTGYTCGDLFYQDVLYQKSLENLQRILKASKKSTSIIAVGLYIEIESCRFNCGALIQNGEIKGIVPKMFTANAKEGRWFAPGAEIADKTRSVRLFGKDIPFGHLIFKDESSCAQLGLEIGADNTLPVAPCAGLALNGANIILNPSACVAAVSKAEYQHNLILCMSAANRCGYVSASAGVHESSTDSVFDGQSLIAEDGTMIAHGSRFERNGTVLYGDIDIEKLRTERMRSSGFSASAARYGDPTYYRTIELDPLYLLDVSDKPPMRYFEKNPFLSENPIRKAESCSDIFSIQTAGLAKRIEHTKASKTVIGISGGLDSTLALLVCSETYKMLEKDPKDIVTLTMPGFGTTDKTYHNAVTLMNLLGTDMREISIKDSVLQHFNDIGHDASMHDVIYENAQARERTQILMDIANKENGLVVGTGDLSEAALGWCTYNGDHMSMYNVNAAIPKTLIRPVIEWIIDNKQFDADSTLFKKTLRDILGTPISPELLPPDEGGNIAQKTEDLVGPYALHDFFIFYTLRHGMRPEKLFYLAKHAFGDEYTPESIKKYMHTFYRRFFNQQFKRSCSPDGPALGSISLSPRDGLAMPSDADVQTWLEETE